MSRDSDKAAGESVYRKADAQLGVKPHKRSSSGWRALPGISWLMNGRMPSLWLLARLQLALGIISLIAGVMLGLGAALLILGLFGEDGAGFAINAIIGAFTFGTSTALLLFGAAVTSYFAARNDREVGDNVLQARPEAPPETGNINTRPVKGIVPKMDLGDYEDHKND